MKVKYTELGSGAFKYSCGQRDVYAYPGDDESSHQVFISPVKMPVLTLNIPLSGVRAIVQALAESKSSYNCLKTMGF